MDISTSVPSLVEQLADPNEDSKFAAQQIEKIACSEGLSLADISSLLDLVLHEPTISTTLKNTIIEKCLIPRSEYFFHKDLLLSILSSVGAPEIYYNNGKQHKSRRLSLTLQQKMLRWTLSTLPYYGPELYHILTRSLPLLFGLLSYEFSRPYIVSLISICLCRATASLSTTTPLRGWHIQLISDLHEKFPYDPSLKALASLVNTLDGTKGQRQSLRSGTYFSVSDSANALGIPDEDLITTIKKVNVHVSSEHKKDISKLECELSRIYERFQDSHKRRRIDQSAKSSFDVINSSSSVNSKMPITAIKSTASLVSNFERIEFSNPSSVFAVPSSGVSIKCQYLSLYLLNSERSDSTIKKLISALRYHVFSKTEDFLVNNNFNNFSILHFARYGGLLFLAEEVETFVKTQHTANTEFDDILDMKINLIPFLAHSDDHVMLKDVLNNVLFKLRNRSSGAQLLTACCLWNLKSLCLISSHDDGNGANIVSTTLLDIFTFINDAWEYLELLPKLAFVSLLATVKVFHLASLWSAKDSLLVPPALHARLLTSTNPLIVSEYLGYLSFLKSVKFPNENSTSEMQSGYVMDSINFLWRDMAFKKVEDSHNRGLCLSPRYLERLGGSNFFGYSDLVSMKSIGGLAQNPSLSYLCAELMWMLEDASPHITSRHPGPLSQETVLRLQQDTETEWIQMSYHDIKVKILNSLDALGFVGLCDILFASLKSLANRRERE